MQQTAATICCLLAAVWWGAVPAALGQSNVPVNADNIVVVLDASGSMGDPMPRSRKTKMNVAKTALLSVMKQVPPDTRVALLVFSGARKRSDWVYPLAPMDIRQFENGLQPLIADGGTPLGKYLKIGADRLLEQRKEQGGYGTYRLIVVTDGEATDAELVESYTPRVLARGITMEVIGVAMADDHSLATKVHAYRRADDPETLQKALVESIAEIGAATDDTTDEDSFAVIAALPDGMADAMLAALRQSGNEPIDASVTREAKRAAAQQAAPSSSPQPGTQGTTSPSGGVWNPMCLFFCFIGFLFFIQFIRMLRAAAKHAS